MSLCDQDEFWPKKSGALAGDRAAERTVLGEGVDEAVEEQDRVVEEVRRALGPSHPLAAEPLNHQHKDAVKHEGASQSAEQGS